MKQDLRNVSIACPQDIDLSLRPKRSVGKQSQSFCDYVAIARNDAITLILRKSYTQQISLLLLHIF